MNKKQNNQNEAQPKERSTIFDSPSLLGSSQEKSKPSKPAAKKQQGSKRSFSKLFEWFGSLGSTVRLTVYVSAAIVLVSVLLLVVLLPSSDGVTHSHDHEHSVSGSDLENIVNEEQSLLIDRESDELDYMTLENSEGTFTVFKDTSKGALVIKELEGLPQNEQFIEMLWFDALSLGYAYQLAPAAVGELSDYGLSSPLAVVTCSYSDGSVSRFAIGSAIPGSEDDHYFIVDGCEGVFVNSFDEAYFMGSKYWLGDDVFGYETIGIPEIGCIEVDVRGGESFYIAPHKAQDMSDPFYGKDYIITKPYSCGIYDYYMSSLLEELGCFVAYEALCPYPTEAQLKKHGLDKPDVTLSHQRNGEWYTMHISKANYDAFYCIIEGIDIIYQFDANSYPILSQLSLELLRSSEVHVRRFEAIERFAVFCEGKEYEFIISRTPYAGDETVFEYTITLNGTEIETSEYKKVLEVFNTASATAFGGKEKKDEAYLVIEIDYFEGFSAKGERIEYLPCGNRRYLCRINGKGEAVLSQLWADELLGAVEELLQ